MKKRLVSLVLVLMMALTLVPAVFAEVYTPASSSLATKLNELSDNVKVPAAMSVSKDGTADWQQTLTIKEAEMTEKYDYITVLETEVIKRTICEWYEAAKYVIENVVAKGDESFKNMLLDRFNEYNVTGEFTVRIYFPEQFTGDELTKHLDPNTTNTDNMFGFNDEAKELFVETKREVSTINKITTLVITLKIKDFYPTNNDIDGIPQQQLYDGVDTDENTVDTYLNDLTYTVEDIVPGKFSGTLRTQGEMKGTTTMQIAPYADHNPDAPSGVATVKFFTDKVEASLRKYTTGGGNVPVYDDYKITFNIDGNTDEVKPIYARGNITDKRLPAPKKPGYTFHGWYFDSALTEKVEGTFKVDKDMTLYGHWVSDTLLTDDHFAYIIGYPDETVRPERNITREEATMIFYRLLRDEVRDAIFTTNSAFSDIAEERWSNSAISTMANGGYVAGRPNGTFDPEAPITRAEFATMAVRFASLMDTTGVSFTDIEGHWAESYILKAAKAGWIKGYPDGSFKPDEKITRAEAMTLVNNVLMRHVNEEGLHADTRKWIDMKGDEWYYYIVLEATNSHDFTRQTDGFNETWTAILPNKTWK